jgi:hypothetical protein
VPGRSIKAFAPVFFNPRKIAGALRRFFRATGEAAGSAGWPIFAVGITIDLAVINLVSFPVFGGGEIVLTVDRHFL